MYTIEKTIFGNYKKQATEEYINQLNAVHEEKITTHQETLAALELQVESFKSKEQEIGESIVYAKTLITQSREKAKREADEVLTNARAEYKTIQDSMLSEIDKLVQKRQAVEKLYLERVEEIKKALDAVVLDDDPTPGIERNDAEQIELFDNVLQLRGEL